MVLQEIKLHGTLHNNGKTHSDKERVDTSGVTPYCDKLRGINICTQEVDVTKYESPRPSLG